ncbi:MAG: hypothetical protein KBC58_02915 [Flavobacterium sp.]|nr:hypothetical protein [Flavobacterium sp.]
MEFKKNVFVVLTEYQFLQASNIAIGSYDDSSYKNLIYVIRNGNRLRGLQSNKDLKINNTHVIILEGYAPKSVVDKILEEKPNHFFFFQAINAINVYLGYTLAKKGTEISLGPDGYGTYSKFKKKNWFLSFLRDTFKQNKFLIQNKLFANKILPFDYYSFGNHKFINNLWITHPEQYQHSSKNKVNIIKLPSFNQGSIDFIKNCFEFDEDYPTENVIYYFNQPFWPTLIDKEFDFLEEVLKHFPEKNIVIKLHPLTSPAVILRYKEFKKFEIINSTVPAEVILLNLKNCIVFSGWSTVLITENSSCNYYFNYPIYKDLNDKILSQIEILALNHITFINSPEEMQFPNG